MSGINYTQNVFLRGMSCIYLIAFASIYLQIPGLFGSNGILPARTQLKSLPGYNVLQVAPYLGVNTEYMMSLIAVIGTCLSFLGFVSQMACNFFVFSALWLLYLSLYQVGQIFMKTQWDMLLLESGFLAMLMAPISGPFSNLKSSTCDSFIFWMVKWLLFRVIFSSGVTKLTSRSPSWWGLTGLSTLLEHQSTPTLLAWYAHQLPMWILKLGAVATYFVEIGLSLLFFFPHGYVRRINFYIQVVSQIIIIMTGNHNFYNALPIMLSISLLEDGYFSKLKGQSTVIRWLSATYNVLALIVVYGNMLYLAQNCFSIKMNEVDDVDVDILFTQEQFEDVLKRVLPKIMLFAGILFAIRCSQLGYHEISQKAANMTLLITNFYAMIAFTIFGISLISMSTLSPGGAPVFTPHPKILKIHAAVDHLKIINSYSFVGNKVEDSERHEIVIEGSYSEDGPWLEYESLYKPTNVSADPPLIVIHQPRLDWQMGFADFKNYEMNPWLLSLMYRLVQGHPQVLDLLKTPFPNRLPRYIKASLYKYRFEHASPSEWWTREKVADYVPVFSTYSTELVNYLKKNRVIGAPEVLKYHNEWLVALLDYIRIWVSQVEGNILLLSLLVTGYAVIASKPKLKS